MSSERNPMGNYLGNPEIISERNLAQIPKTIMRNHRKNYYYSRMPF